MKYNPAFLTDEQQRAGFAVRHIELELILESLRENTSEASQHLLILGPRGAGKSTLVHRVAGEILADPELSRCYMPVRFGEESYEVDSAGALWLEALLHVAHQTRQPRWQAVHAQLRSERDPERLRQLALAELHAYCESIGRRLVLVVENLHMMLSEQISKDEAWTLRHTLLNDPHIVLLATATSRFSAIDAPDEAMYELFRVISLAPLVATECATLWGRLTGKVVDERQGRALEILTGGNIRLLTILVSFASDDPLPAVLDNLHRLIDDHTDFFRSNIESLPPGERRVFAALADHWSPATASELAEALRSEVSVVSAQLARLEQRGVVTATGTRRKRYQLVERLYNIYYLLRRHGGASDRVQVVIDFIAAYYTPDTLVDRLVSFAAQSIAASDDQRMLYIRAFVGLYRKIAATHGEALQGRLPAGFLELPELPPEFRARVEQGCDAGEVRRAWFMSQARDALRGSAVLGPILAALEQSPGLSAALAELKRSGPPPQEWLESLKGEALRVELGALRESGRHACVDALARGDASRTDLGCVALLSLVWLGDIAMAGAAMDRLLAPIRDDPYVGLLELHLMQAATPVAPEEFAARVTALVERHADQLLLPFAGALLVVGHGAPAAAGALVRDASLWGRLVPLAGALVEIFHDICDEETEIVLEPGAAFLVPLLVPRRWGPIFIALAWVSDWAAERPADAVEIVRRGLTIAPTSFRLNAQLGWLQHQRMGMFAAGEETLQAAFTYVDGGWEELALQGVLLIEPLRDVEAAIAVLRRSWAGYSQAVAKPQPLPLMIELWLGLSAGSLRGHRVRGLFVAAFRLTAEAAKEWVEALIRGDKPPSGIVEHPTVSLCMRGEARWLIERIKEVRDCPPPLQILAAGVSTFLGEPNKVPAEVERIAEDIAFDLRWTHALYQTIVGGADPEAAGLDKRDVPDVRAVRGVRGRRGGLRTGR